MEDDFTYTANLLAEPTRATMLLKLLSGKALPAGELAAAARISPQTASGHLTKLVRASLVNVENQGRHRYYRLAGTDVADALEAILVLLPSSRKEKNQWSAPPAGTLAYARTCYSHLAGWLGVRIAGSLQAKGYLSAGPNKSFLVSERGREWFLSLGVPVSERIHHFRGKYARQCLDWTERRPHLAGPLGVAMYRRFVDLKWLVPGSRDRIARLTLLGKEELWKHLRIPLR